MKYIGYSLVFLIFVGCGNQHEGEGQLRLVGKEKKELTSAAISSVNNSTQHEQNHSSPEKSEELLLAELSAKSKWEMMKFQAQHEKALKELEKELSLAKLKNQQEMESAKLNQEKEIQLATLSSHKEMVFVENETRVKTQEKDNALYQLITLITASLFILFLLTWYFIHRRTKNTELKKHEDELRHRELLEANKQHNENVRKMLEILADEKTNEGVKKELVLLLKEQEHNKRETLLIEHQE